MLVRLDAYVCVCAASELSKHIESRCLSRVFFLRFNFEKKFKFFFVLLCVELNEDERQKDKTTNLQQFVADVNGSHKTC